MPPSRIELHDNCSSSQSHSQAAQSPGGHAYGADSNVTVLDVLDILELRISMETEAASLAAARRSAQDVRDLGAALAQMRCGMAGGSESVETDTRFHRLIAHATHLSNSRERLRQSSESIGTT